MNRNITKYISLIIIFTIIYSFTNNKLLSDYQKQGTLYKKLKTYGISFLTSSHQGNKIDGVSTSPNTVNQARKKIKETLDKCNPCWLEQYDYNTRKLIRKGYSVPLLKNSYHRIFFGELTEYDKNDEIIFHKKDSTIDLKAILLMNQDSIVKYLKTNKQIIKTF